MTQSKNTCRSEFTVPSKAYVIDPGTAQDLYQVTVAPTTIPRIFMSTSPLLATG